MLSIRISSTRLGSAVNDDGGPEDWDRTDWFGVVDADLRTRTDCCETDDDGGTADCDRTDRLLEAVDADLRLRTDGLETEDVRGIDPKIVRADAKRGTGGCLTDASLFTLLLVVLVGWLELLAELLLAELRLWGRRNTITEVRSTVLQMRGKMQ